MTVLAHRADLGTATAHRALHYLPATALALDLVALAAATVVATLGRAYLPFFDQQVVLTETVGWLGPIMLLIWAACLWRSGSYQPSLFGAGADEYKRVANASLLAAGLVGVGCYLVKFELSRGFFMLVVLIGVPALLTGRWALRKALHRARVDGHLTVDVLVAGSLSHVDEVTAVLRREPWLGYRVVGALTPGDDFRTATAFGVPIVGRSDEAASVVRATGADAIFFAEGSRLDSTQMRRLAWELESDDVQVIMAPALTDVSSERVSIRPVGGLPLVHVDPPRASHAVRWAKRLFDVVGSVALIVAFSPLLLIAAIQVKRADGGPVLFKQVRTGVDHREFHCLKFRTMCVDAEARLAALHEAHGHEGGLFKLKDDPRITRPGRWLRRFSVDEIPQLFNVLRGEMSLVGPRPPLPHEVATYDDDTQRRLRVRPGMTGLWQVSGRSDLAWDEAVRLDLYYVDNWSMLQDLNILSRTFSAVFSSRGAY